MFIIQRFTGHCTEFNVHGGVIQDQMSTPCNDAFPKCGLIYNSSDAYKCMITEVYIYYRGMKKLCHKTLRPIFKSQFIDLFLIGNYYVLFSLEKIFTSKIKYRIRLVTSYAFIHLEHEPRIKSFRNIRFMNYIQENTFL